MQATTDTRICSDQSCGHYADLRWEWAPGHLGGYKCHCCAVKIWRETIKNCKQAIEEAEAKGVCA